MIYSKDFLGGVLTVEVSKNWNNYSLVFEHKQGVYEDGATGDIIGRNWAEVRDSFETEEEKEEYIKNMWLSIAENHIVSTFFSLVE